MEFVTLSEESSTRRSGIRYSLAALFGVVTLACLFFAYPRFMLGGVGLLGGVAVAMVVFVVFIFYPVTWLVEAIRGKGKDSDSAKSPFAPRK